MEKQDYNNASKARQYISFLASQNGLIQQEVLFKCISNRLAKNKDQEVLDLACGPGWLTKRLSQSLPKIQGCDLSEEFIAYAKETCKNIEFKVLNALGPLPYPKGFFDCVIFNMAAPDVGDLPNAFCNIFSILKEKGNVVITVPNPYYTYPAAVWKRDALDVLTGGKPRLRLNGHYHYLSGRHIEREFKKGEKISSRFYALSDYFAAALAAGFQLVYFEDVKSAPGSKEFDLQYQLSLYPLILLMEFRKPDFSKK